MSPWWNSASSGRFARLPEYVSLSRTTTSSPPRWSRLTKCEPMKPAPPVTRIRIEDRLVPGRRKQACEGAGHPPVPAAEQPHRRGHDHEPDQRCVEEDRHGEADSELLERRSARDRECGEDRDHHG